MVHVDYNDSFLTELYQMLLSLLGLRTIIMNWSLVLLILLVAQYSLLVFGGLLMVETNQISIDLIYLCNTKDISRILRSNGLLWQKSIIWGILSRTILTSIFRCVGIIYLYLYNKFKSLFCMYTFQRRSFHQNSLFEQNITLI